MKNMLRLAITAFLVIESIDVLPQSIEKEVLILSSLSNEKVKVDLDLDDFNDRITLSLGPKEKLCINGYRELANKIEILDKKFICVNYKIRGGSGVRLRNTAFFCVDKSKLYKALDVISMESYNFSDTYDRTTDSLKLFDERGSYSLRFIELRKSKLNFQLIAIQYEQVSSKYDKNQNFKRTDTIKFNFDLRNKAFYTDFESLKGNFNMERTKSMQRRFKGERYPLINLRESKYIFIDNSWYIKTSENHLVEIPNTCHCF